MSENQNTKKSLSNSKKSIVDVYRARRANELMRVGDPEPPVLRTSHVLLTLKTEQNKLKYLNPDLFYNCSNNISWNSFYWSILVICYWNRKMIFIIAAFMWHTHEKCSCASIAAVRARFSLVPWNYIQIGCEWGSISLAWTATKADNRASRTYSRRPWL